MAGAISLRGVAVHNLQHIDLDLPHHQLVVFCGLSGSGKSSLALDTLYAEGQRRYIESFSAYTRQFLDRLEKPEAERIDGIPPAVAVTGRGTTRSSRATVGTVTEVVDYLRLLLARIGQVHCDGCGRPVRRDTPQNVAEWLATLPPETRAMIAYPVACAGSAAFESLASQLREEGFIRVIVDGQTIDLGGALPRVAGLPSSGGAATERAAAGAPAGSETPTDSPRAVTSPVTVAPSSAGESAPGEVWVVVDRITAGAPSDRVRDSLETAFRRGQGRCDVFVAASDDAQPPAGRAAVSVDGRAWWRCAWSDRLRCEDCGREFPVPEPRLLSFNSPLGACPECEGFGNVIAVDMDLVVPDPKKTIRQGAIAPWNTPSYAHELKELMALADDYGLPLDVPFRELEPRHVELIVRGVPERRFGGLDGFFAWLERRKYKMHIRVFLSRWRSYRPCPACGGARLRAEALNVRLGGRNIAEICAMKVAEALAFLDAMKLTPWQRQVGRMMLDQVRARLGYLDSVGLGYLTLDRTIRTLSGGEARRVALGSALGSSLVNMLYVLDEPSIGLHPRDVERLVGVLRRLRDRGNTVVVVEHEEAIIRAADQVVEIGPGAGQRGGRIVFQGTPREMEQSPESLTGDYLAGRRGVALAGRRRAPSHGWIRLSGACGNNLKSITVEFPLGVLCLVTGVSGSGKSTLVQRTLYPALCRRMGKDAPKPYPFDDIAGDGQLDDVILVDQSPIGRSPRSNPVTYLKVCDEIRAVFADTVEAKTRGLSAGHFSFNMDGGRCPNCQGEGQLQVDMQFLADIYMRCPECDGTRYRPEVLGVTYRGRNIADVLEMTVREAFTFFRGQAKVQARLKRLIDVGLDYVRLGQPANTLSGGEAQRLKLAAYMSAAKRGRALFLLDEPTTGLHFADIVQLIDCFDALLAVGHSLIVVEHNLQVMRAADYIIDLGPGAADEGGAIVAQGTPELVARSQGSVTGRFLAAALKLGAPSV